MPFRGDLKIQCFQGDNYVPLDRARITISPTGQFVSPNAKTIQLITDSSGLTQQVPLDTPPIDYSQAPTNQIPYSLANVRVERDGFEPLFVRGCQVYPDRVAFQQCRMVPVSNTRQQQDIIVILPNKLVGNFPPKIPESPEKVMPPPASGVVLPYPVVPEYVVVHQGVPNDASAPNYTVRYKDYIKNVASSEIFPTWSDNTIRANLYCIISFTLNRIYTEWYRGKGKNFDITSSTAYDHAFSYGRNIFDNIDRIADEIFSSYVKRPGRRQPLLTQYCDGKNVQCPGWLTQWGSKYLGDEGKAPFDILTSFYGTDLELNRADQVKGIPSSYPGYNLTIGAKGEPVRTIQTFLNRISVAYPLIPKLSVDGDYGPNTANSVKTFQGVFNLPQTGVVDYATWYKISDVYVGVSKIAELRGYSYDTKEVGIERTFFPPSTNIYRNDDVPYVQYFDDLY
ncbi:peptidoglycan-binding domain-containing protein [Clostridium manihotivorum]|uniref:Spore cortex-lytic protein n=1 Tax=Clostridium manihotivorum TaxID=2320868 RepID=A0A3R5U7A7_9CLOT|nr:peptidoglycan-binding domain-containing protein [Clostridium manihotivorum]QAA30635.1 spore cortex-lytic protein [Clostridium manihotivorum]